MYYAISSLLLILTTIIICYLFYIDRHLRYWKRKGVGTPITGLWAFLSYMHTYIQTPAHEMEVKNYKKYGRIHGVFSGLTPHLVIGDPDLIKQVLIKDFYKFHNRLILRTGEPSFDNMLTNLMDEDWRRIRCIMSPTFSSGRMRTMTSSISECAENITKHFEKLAEINEPVDCRRYTTNFLIDVISSVAFGTKLNSLEDPDNEFVTNARRVFTLHTTFLSIILLLIPGSSRLTYSNIDAETFQYFRNYALHVIKERDEKKFRGKDFLQLMVDAQRGLLKKTQEEIQEEKLNRENISIEVVPKHKTMSMDELLAQCSLFLFAGSDTTAIALAFFLYYMALYPNCQERLIKEIDEAWGKKDPMNVDILNQMPYLDATLNESLRLQPIGQLVRVCTEDCELGDTGIKISKGTNVGVPTYAIHHDPDFFPNPEEFDPERFMPENRNSILQYTFLTFGYGPRNCIGMRFVNMILKICILHVFRRLRVRATEETKKPVKFFCGQGLLLPKEIIVKFEKRQC